MGGGVGTSFSFADPLSLPLRKVKMTRDVPRGLRDVIEIARKWREYLERVAKSIDIDPLARYLPWISAELYWYVGWNLPGAEAIVETHIDFAWRAPSFVKNAPQSVPLIISIGDEQRTAYMDPLIACLPPLTEGATEDERLLFGTTFLTHCAPGLASIALAGGNAGSWSRASRTTPAEASLSLKHDANALHILRRGRLPEDDRRECRAFREAACRGGR